MIVHMLGFSLLVCPLLIFAQDTTDVPTSKIFTVAPTDDGASAREEQIALARSEFLYGPSPLGNLSFYPTGPLGNATVTGDVLEFFNEANSFGPLLQVDAQRAVAKIQTASGINELSDYLKLYQGQWLYSNPEGVNLGFSTNYTQDLYFSMERLSLNPYSVRRVHPSEQLPFQLNDGTTVNITTQTLGALHQAGRLFMVDYSFLDTIPVMKGKFLAACVAYFYLHPESEEFLPLAIKTNLGDDMVYTPLDGENDWFLAKTMFESNDNFFLASYHLGSTHATVEIMHSAAVRSMAAEHPIRGLFDRIMYRGYAIRTAGAMTLFAPGGEFDQSFALGVEGFYTYSAWLYHTDAGRVQSNYVDRFFVERGLVNCTFGPELPIFPFMEDVVPIMDVLRSFLETYVTSYYGSDQTVAADKELQAWVEEAGPAGIYEFPASPITQRETITELLLHIAYLAGIEHHALNTNSLAASWTLPLHPASHWAPLPTEKGIDSVMPYLPNLNQSIAQIGIENTFSRPNLMYQNGTMVNMFSDPAFLKSTTDEIRIAASQFLLEMAQIGAAMDSKTFDDQGLSQGMPFIWRDVNPLKMPFFLAI